MFKIVKNVGKMAYGIQPFPVTLWLLNVYENQPFNNDEMI